MTIARRFLYDTADAVRLEALVGGSWAPLAELVGKLVREERYHLMHVGAWLERLARDAAASRATGCSRRSTELAPDAATVFTPLADEAGAARGRDPRRADGRARGPLARRRSPRSSRTSTCRCRRRRATRSAAGSTTASRFRLAVGRVHVGPPRRPGSDLVSESRDPGRRGRTRAGAMPASGTPRRPPWSTRRPCARPSPRSWTRNCRCCPIVDLGIDPPRRHRAECGPIAVEILPTFVGCPALELIKASIADAARRIRAPGPGRRPRSSRRGRSERITPAGRAALLDGRDRAARSGAARPPSSTSTARPVPALRLAPDDRRERCSGRPNAGPSATAPTAASRSKRSSRSDGAVGRRARRSAIVGIVGAGTMGAGIAQVALEAGCEVVIYDVDDGCHRARPRADPRRSDAAGGETRPRRDEADDWVEARLDRLAPRPDARRRSPTTADLVIEAALEDLALKRAIFRSLDAWPTRRAILATNTSALSVAAIAEATRPAGAGHRPALLQPGAGHGPRRGRRAAARRPRGRGAAVAIMTAWGKTPGRLCRLARASSSTGSTGRSRSRRCGSSRAARRASPRSTRRCATAGFPMGPFELMDLTGIDVTLAAATGIWEGLGRPGPASAVADPGSPGGGRRPGPQDRPGLLPVRGRPAPRRGRAPADLHLDGAPRRRRRSATGSSTRSPTRRGSPSTRASRPPTSSTSPCVSAPGTRMALSSLDERHS